MGHILAKVEPKKKSLIVSNLIAPCHGELPFQKRLCTQNGAVSSVLSYKTKVGRRRRESSEPVGKES